METLPSPYGPPLGQAVLRSRPEDFQVEEIPVCVPDGTGEHVWLKICKRGQNTDWVARQLARFAGVRPRDVSFAGLKDRHAVTEQWFSVHLPGRAEPDWGRLESDELQVLTAARHGRKLRRGALRGNRFRIRLREVQTDPQALARRVESLRCQGVPNYFGGQRFGRGAGNLEQARALFEGRLGRVSRHKRSLYLSAARSLLFNRVLACRIERGLWQRCLPGDCMRLDGRRGRFLAETLDDELLQRFAALEIHPTGPLWGRGDPGVQDEALALEREALTGLDSWLAGLEAAGLEADRRSLRVSVADLTYGEAPEGGLDFSFSLPAGAYATVLLSQLFTLRDASLPSEPVVDAQRKEPGAV